MNVIISNKLKPMIDSLNVEVIKRLDGEFSVNEIINQFKNFYYQRMILDITSLKNYRDIKTLQKLSISLDMDKLILVLDDSEEMSGSSFLSRLISIGIYNFTRNVEGILYLYNNPNSYRDVADLHQIDMVNSDNSPTGFGTIQPNYAPQSPIRRIIGVKNVTKQSGATTLIYMMKKHLEKNYSVVAIEVDKKDFWYMRTNFNKPEENMISTTNADVGNVIAQNIDANVILIDINTSPNAESLCQEIIYLVESSIIKLNSLLMVDNRAFDRLKDKKVVLNQSILEARDVADFEYESGVKVFFNMPPLDERQKNIDILNVFLVKLGFTMQQTEEMTKRRRSTGLF